MPRILSGVVALIHPSTVAKTAAIASPIAKRSTTQSRVDVVMSMTTASVVQSAAAAAKARI